MAVCSYRCVWKVVICFLGFSAPSYIRSYCFYASMRSWAPERRKRAPFEKMEGIIKSSSAVIQRSASWLIKCSISQCPAEMILYKKYPKITAVVKNSCEYVKENGSALSSADKRSMATHRGHHGPPPADVPVWSNLTSHIQLPVLLALQHMECLQMWLTRT